LVLFAGRIAAGEGRFNTNSEVIINTEVKSIPVNKKGVYFAFRDQGACISLLAIRVSDTQPFRLRSKVVTLLTIAYMMVCAFRQHCVTVHPYFLR